MPDCIKRLLIGSYIIIFVIYSALVVSDTRKAPARVERADYIAKITVTPTPTATPSPTQAPTPTPIEYEEITVKVMYTESLGYYFITAYSPLETGSWYTASGTCCHRADEEERYTDPTTCAVDPRLHNIGEDGDLFYIEEFDRVFIAEDTGGAVKGKHIDVCFCDDTLESVYNFPTGYYEVYAVYYEEITLEVKKNTEIKSVITEEELEELYLLEEVR